MSHHPVHQSKSSPLWKSTSKIQTGGTSKSEILKTRTSPNLTRDVKRPKDKAHLVQSESKFNYIVSKSAVSHSKSDSRTLTAPKHGHGVVVSPPKLLHCQRHLSGDTGTVHRTEKKRQPILNITQSNLNTHYNSYSHNHGIITASALRELKSGII